MKNGINIIVINVVMALTIEIEIVENVINICLFMIIYNMWFNISLTLLFKCNIYIFFIYFYFIFYFN